MAAYREFVCQNQLKVLIDRFTDAFEFARDSAITTHSTIIFCAKNTDNACGTHWNNGQLILNKSTQNILHELPEMPNTYTLHWRSSLGYSADLRWQADGFTRGQQGSFFICGPLSAQIIILRSGRWRVVTGEIAGCHSACYITKNYLVPHT